MKTRTTNFENFKTKLAKKNTIDKTAKKQIKGGVGNNDVVLI